MATSDGSVLGSELEPVLGQAAVGASSVSGPSPGTVGTALDLDPDDTSDVLTSLLSPTQSKEDALKQQVQQLQSVRTVLEYRLYVLWGRVQLLRNRVCMLQQAQLAPFLSPLSP